MYNVQIKTTMKCICIWYLGLSDACAPDSLKIHMYFYLHS